MGKTIHSTLCYIKNKQNEYLLLHRVKKEHDLNEGKWIGVGGKFEPGESADECVCREVYEETGLTLTAYHLHGIVHFLSDEWDDEEMYLYSATGFTATLREDCPEGELAWIPQEQVLSLPTWEGDHYFLEPLLAGEERINVLVQYAGEKLIRVEQNCE